MGNDMTGITSKGLQTDELNNLQLHHKLQPLNDHTIDLNISLKDFKQKLDIIIFMKGWFIAVVLDALASTGNWV